MTDMADWLGRSHRDTRVPEQLSATHLTTRRRQGEHAAAVLQASPVSIEPGASASWRFVAVLLADHAEATSESDLAHWQAWGHRNIGSALSGETGIAQHDVFPSFSSVFESMTLDEASLAMQVSGQHRHVERHEGVVQSFFVHEHAHVVTRDKERRTARPTGHVLRTGEGLLPAIDHLCCTCWMRGVFASHVAIGNTSFGKMMPIARSPLDAIASGGLRIMVRSAADPAWRWLTVPSTFSVTRAGCAWSYIGHGVHLLVTVDASPNAPLLDYALYVLAGEAVECRLVSWVSLGNHELDQRGEVVFDDARGVATLRPVADSFWAQHVPDACFAMALEDRASWSAMGGGSVLGLRDEHAPMVVMQSVAVGGVSGESTEPGVLRWRIAGGVSGVSSLEAVLESAAVDPSEAGRHWRVLLPAAAVAHTADERVSRVGDALPWMIHNAVIHMSSPHGLEQNSGAAWGTRDVCQGPVEVLAALDRLPVVREVLCEVFANQFEPAGDGSGYGGHWPQWFMLPPFGQIRPDEAHGDVIVWPLLALADYLENTGDATLLDVTLPFVVQATHRSGDQRARLLEHVERALDHVDAHRVAGTALPMLGEGDWNDALQASDPLMRRQLVSGWTVPLLYQALSKLAGALRRLNRDAALVKRLETSASAIARDYQRFIVKDGQAAGLVRFEGGRAVEWLLHPSDTRTGIHHRLLAVERGVLSGLFTVEQAEHHVGLIEKHLLGPDGARLMTRPPRYHGGLECTFKRAESAAAFSREIGLMYAHAHLRYAELRAVMGHADALFEALLKVSPVAIAQSVSGAEPRQANAYFSSSDACFDHRDEADARYGELMSGESDVRFEGGWRVYSSGPGIYVGLVVRRWLGLRRSFEHVVIDPVLPASLSGLRAALPMFGRTLRVTYTHTGSPSATLNGQPLPTVGREANPYRAGGIKVSAERFTTLLHEGENVLLVTYG